MSIGINLAKMLNGSYLDSNNIYWKNINGKMIGKPVVWITPYKAGWQEDL